MPLSCSCDGDDEFDWYYETPDDYCTTPVDGNRKRCKSCKTLIGKGALAIEFTRYEKRFNEFGEELSDRWLASFWHCERCADLYYSLFELGFTCNGPDEDMRELVHEYAETYQPTT